MYNDIKYVYLKNTVPDAQSARCHRVVSITVHDVFVEKNVRLATLLFFL